MSRPYKDCQHFTGPNGEPLHSHGTRAAYVRDGCRCRDCTDANTREQGIHNREKVYGRYDDGRVDAAPAAAHLEALIDSGISLDQVARLIGCSRSTLHLLRGTYSPGKKPQERILRRISDGILFIENDPIKYAHPNRPISGVGTARRLQALVAIGWTQKELARRIGWSQKNMTILVHGGARMVEAKTVRAVRALYDELWDQPQDGDFGSRVARRLAENNGWVSPLGWDDEDIDDPTKEPAIMEPVPRNGGGAHVYVHYNDVIHLLDGGVGYGEVLARMNIQDLQTLRLGLTRRGRRDLADQFAKLERRGSNFEVVS